jgi:hypothetical protein
VLGSWIAELRRNQSIAVFVVCAVIVVSSISAVRLVTGVSSAVPSRTGLLDAAEHVLSSAKSSRYQYVTYVDEVNGVYEFDCSGFVDYILQKTFPDAFAAVEYHSNRLNRPYHEDYYRLFAKLRTDDNVAGWHSVARTSELLPGDVIAWLGPANRNRIVPGHVMVVRSNPTPVPNVSNETLFAIIDSTEFPHALDSRANGATGIGTGTISLVMNRTGSPIGYRWRDGQSVRTDYTRIAIGELGPSRNAIYGILNSSSAQVLTVIVATILVCAVVSSIVIMKLRRAKFHRQKPNL